VTESLSLTAGKRLLQQAQQALTELEAVEDPTAQQVTREKIVLQLQVGKTSLQAQVQQAEVAYQEYPAFVPEDAPLRAEKHRAELLLIESQLDLAFVDYWLAQAYMDQKQNRQAALVAALTGFEELHQRYRSQVAGLYARLMQGRCCQELDEIGESLGIYEELLEHNAQSPSLIAIKDRALLYRLTCLNGPARKDYVLVDSEATGWLQAHPQRADQATGQGIRWELCQALERLGSDARKSPAVRATYLARALQESQTLNHVGGKYRRVTADLMDILNRRISGELPPEETTSPASPKT
jgi:hypothetical protein